MTELVLKLEDDELIELHSFFSGLLSNADLKSKAPMIRMAVAVFRECNDKASDKVKKQVVENIKLAQEVYNAEENIVSRQNIENGIHDLQERIIEAMKNKDTEE